MLNERWKLREENRIEDVVLEVVEDGGTDSTWSEITYTRQVITIGKETSNRILRDA